MKKQPSLPTILLVEDNVDDYEAAIRSFKAAHLDNPVHWCKSGQEALDYLKHEGSYAQTAPGARPALVLLDLNMPGIDGRKVLAIVKQDETLKKIPVVVLTTSSDERDVTQCYQLSQHLHPKAGRFRRADRSGRADQGLLVRHRAFAGRLSMEMQLNLLVIDDSVDDRMLYRRALTGAFGKRLNLTEEASGDNALDAIEHAEPLCVLLDYSLPGRNGIEVLKRIRAKHKHLAVVLLTGQGNEDIAVRAMKEGAQDYITKATITSETLSHVVRRSNTAQCKGESTSSMRRSRFSPMRSPMI
jgi:CheY-like chemotaxis protein